MKKDSRLSIILLLALLCNMFIIFGCSKKTLQQEGTQTNAAAEEQTADEGPISNVSARKIVPSTIYSLNSLTMEQGGCNETG